MRVREINKIIVHCSDSPDHLDFGLKEVNLWHFQRGFSASISTGFHCGYHYLIRRDGIVEVARPDDEPGIHCKGQNRDSVSICWMGRDKPSKEQKMALDALLCTIMASWALTPKHVFGHSEFNSHKTCPNLGDLDKFRDGLHKVYENMGVKNGFRHDLQSDYQ